MVAIARVQRIFLAADPARQSPRCGERCVQWVLGGRTLRETVSWGRLSRGRDILNRLPSFRSDETDRGQIYELPGHWWG